MGIVTLHESLQRLWAYWRSKRGTREMPERSDIDPAQIPDLLPQITLFEVIGGRFQFRLAGTQIVDAYGVEPRGKFLDEILPPSRAEAALRGYKLMLERRRPVLVRGEMIAPSGNSFFLTRILLPLAAGGASVAFVLVGFVIERWAAVDIAPLGPATDVAQMAWLQVLDDPPVPR